ncbi:unnamed protein product [Schistosoma mattheei]|uniref:Uncharacterized protein n=1 Tax=Schistosoma mattheei TaxID=31246 RepID=A0A183PS11_9TREM|nr:unnamed protein product [Schistosoma mattheei]
MDNNAYEDIVVRHELEERNENCERFENLCGFNKLVIGGAIFPHKRINKATWVSPDYITENRLGHIYISKKFGRSMENEYLGGGTSADGLERRIPPQDTKERFEKLYELVKLHTTVSIGKSFQQTVAEPDEISVDAQLRDQQAGFRKDQTGSRRYGSLLNNQLSGIR